MSYDIHVTYSITPLPRWYRRWVHICIYATEFHHLLSNCNGARLTKIHACKHSNGYMGLIWFDLHPLSAEQIQIYRKAPIQPRTVWRIVFMRNIAYVVQSCAYGMRVFLVVSSGRLISRMEMMIIISWSFQWCSTHAQAAPVRSGGSSLLSHYACNV